MFYRNATEIFLYSISLGQKQQMLICVVNLRGSSIRMSISQVLCRRKGNDIFQVETDFWIICFGENMMHMDSFVIDVNAVQMFCLCSSCLVIKETQESFCFCGLITIICVINLSRMLRCVFFSCDAFRLI